MVRSKFRNNFLKSRSASDKKAYSKQRHSCVKLIKGNKKSNFSNLNNESITENNFFWKTMKNPVNLKI